MTMPENIRNFLLELADLMEEHGVGCVSSDMNIDCVFVADDFYSVDLHTDNTPDVIRQQAVLTPPPEGEEQ